MAQQTYPCENCRFRAQYDKNPKSFLGRFWRWHIGFCPGWKAYFTHQDEQTKAALREKYNLRMRAERYLSAENSAEDEKYLRK